jgi:hypothetical protein
MTFYDFGAIIGMGERDVNNIKKQLGAGCSQSMSVTEENYCFRSVRQFTGIEKRAGLIVTEMLISDLQSLHCFTTQ